MKKTLFTALRAMCVGAMTLFAVSCYDDSALWSEIEDLDARLTALEEKLNTEVATLNSKLGALETAYEKADSALLASVQKLTSDLDALDGTVDGYVKSNDEALKAAIEEYKKADETLAAVDTDILAALATMGVAKVEKNAAGNVVITFVDESTVEVGAADANANNTGLVTVVDGKWAVVGADGKTTVLDAELHPDTKLAFKVNVDNNELYVSYDDGTTWEPTGVIVKDATTINVVTAFKDGEDFVTLTVGGVEYQLPKYVDFSTAMFDRASWYVPYGATRTANLTVVECHEYYVTSKPDGWKAVLEGSVLTVTAPAEELITMGAAEMVGEVLVHADADNGACKIVKLDVTAGPAMTLSYYDGNLTFFNASLVYTVDEMCGDVWVEFASAWFGLISIDEFVKYESFDAYMKTQPEGLSNLQQILFNQFQEEHYESGKDEFEATWSLKEIVDNSWSGFELDENETYLMWVAPQGTAGLDYDKAFYVVTGEYVDFEATQSLYNDVKFNATFFGADKFVVGAVSKSTFDEWGIGDDFTYEDALMSYLMGSWMPGPLPQFAQGNLEAMGKVYDSGKHVTDLGSAVLADMGNRAPITADTEYFVWVLPYYANKAEYAFEDLILSTVKTSPRAYSANYVADVKVAEFTDEEANITVTPPAGGTTWYDLIDAETYATLVVDGAVDPASVVAYFKNSYNYVESEQTDDWSWLIEPGMSYVFVTYTTAGGEYSVGTTTINVPAEAQFETPDGKQWMFKSTVFDEVYGAGKAPDYCFDLGVSMKEQYEVSHGFTASLAVDYEDIYGADAAGYWAAPVYGPHSVVATDETSGVITWKEMSIPYRNYTGAACQFDFSEFFMEDAGTTVVEATLVETPIAVTAQ